MADLSFQGSLSNRTCQICRASDATHFCNCEGQPSLFCLSCITVHYGKDLRIIHQALPIAALGQNPKEYKRKNKALKEAVAALRSNLELVDQFCEEFDKMMKTSIDYFSTFRNWWLQYMQTEKEALSTAIEAAILETTNYLDRGEVPVSVLGQVLWTSSPEELKVVHCSVTVPDLQTLLQSCTFYHNNMQMLCERINLPPQVEEVKSNAAQKLVEMGIKHTLPEEMVNRWMELLHSLKQDDQLEPLFQKIINMTQWGTQMVVGLVQATLDLCTGRPEAVGEVSRGLEILLDKPEAAPLLENLSMLSDSAVVATVLEAVCWQPELLSACTEISILLGFFQRDGLPAPNFLASLLQKPTELIKLAQACSNLLHNPANHMATLSGQLVEAMQSSIPVELLHFIPALVADLLQPVSPERVVELGLLLLAASTDTQHLQFVKDMQTCTAQVRIKLLSLLTRPERLTIEVLRQLFLPLSQTLESDNPQPQASNPTDLTTMAIVHDNIVFLYEIQSMQLSTRALLVDFGDGGCYMQADSNTLLCVGAAPASSAVYLLSLSSFQLTFMPSLSTPRRYAGLAKVNTCFYVFGGWHGNKNLNSCEKMQLSDQHWTQISRMTHPRSSFTPCHYRTLIYLASANLDSQRTVETFDVKTERFAMLPVSLPPQFNLKVPSVAFIVNEELCILTTNKQMARWKIETEREFRLSNTTEGTLSCQQPLIAGSIVLIACKGLVQKFSLESYSFIA